MSAVSFVKIKNNGYKDAVKEALSLIDYDFPRQMKNIIIKANMCYYWDASTGQTTDPKFVGALIEVIREKVGSDPQIFIVESDASAMKCKHAFRYLGYDKLAHDYNVQLINLSETDGEPTRVSVNTKVFDFTVPDLIRSADLKINVAKIKYSWDKIKITCALKNIFGCNPYPKKYKLHNQLNEAIVAINKAMPFDLCFIDGNVVYGMETRKLGLVMARRDSVAVDAAAAQIAGVNPISIPYLNMAVKESLGKTSFVAVGERLEYFRDRYPRKNARKKLMGKAFEIVSFLKLGKRLGLE